MKFVKKYEDVPSVYKDSVIEAAERLGLAFTVKPLEPTRYDVTIHVDTNDFEEVFER